MSSSVQNNNIRFSNGNYIGALQERYLAEPIGPRYREIPDPGGGFACEVVVGQLTATGFARKKKQAKQAAARAMWDKLGTEARESAGNAKGASQIQEDKKKMDRLRQSFRKSRKKKTPSNDDSIKVDSEAEPSLAPAAPSMMQKLRRSLRLKKKKDKDKESKSPSIASEPIELEKIPSRKSKLRKSLRLSIRRKKKDNENSKPSKWENDETDVRLAKCSFPVKYLGSLEVYESRGIEVCEETLKLLKKSKKTSIEGTLNISGDGLQVVDKETKGMIVDQTIEKVSFCAPDRNFEKGFAYICRDGTTKRWICHGFTATKQSGERLSHALGCAFAVCLEKKQQRQADCGVTMTYNENDGTFTRMGSFRVGTITERLQDPQTFKPVTPPPVQKVENPHAVARPKISDQMYQRQASFRGLGQLSGNSPFKRATSQNASLRLNELPSTLQRIEESKKEVSPSEVMPSLILDDTIVEESDKIDELCVEITQGLSKMLESDYSPTKPVQVETFKQRDFDIHNNNANKNADDRANTLSFPGSNFPSTNAMQTLPAQMQQNYSPLKQPLRVQPVQIKSVQKAQENVVNVANMADNPWDNVPDQPKARQQAKSSKQQTAAISATSPADQWLESLTNRIGDLSQKNNNDSINGSNNSYNSSVNDSNNSYNSMCKSNVMYNGSNSPMGDLDEMDDDEWSALANRNETSFRNKQNTNPFIAKV